jgi:Na+-driven multidrug efflux pump
MIPGIIFLPRLWGLDGLWIAMPVSDTLAALLSIYLLLLQLRPLNRMEEGDVQRNLPSHATN